MCWYYKKNTYTAVWEWVHELWKLKPRFMICLATDIGCCSLTILFVLQRKSMMVLICPLPSLETLLHVLLPHFLSSKWYDASFAVWCLDLRKMSRKIQENVKPCTIISMDKIWKQEFMWILFKVYNGLKLFNLSINPVIRSKLYCKVHVMIVYNKSHLRILFNLIS